MSTHNLSPREMEFAKLFACGEKIESAAAQMKCSEATVKKFRDCIYQKLNIHCVAELAHWMLFHNYVQNLFTSRNKIK